MIHGLRAQKNDGILQLKPRRQSRRRKKRDDEIFDTRARRREKKQGIMNVSTLRAQGGRDAFSKGVKMNGKCFRLDLSVIAERANASDPAKSKGMRPMAVDANCPRWGPRPPLFLSLRAQYR